MNFEISFYRVLRNGYGLLAIMDLLQENKEFIKATHNFYNRLLKFFSKYQIELARCRIKSKTGDKANDLF